MGRNDVDITTGGDNSALASSFAELRGFAAKAREDITHEFGRAIAFTGIVGAIEGVIQKAHDLHHEAERFGVDAQFLQLISNAAKEDGVQINSVARAINTLEIATQKARDGNEKSINSFGVLGIKLEDIKNLSPQDLFLRIADGVKNAEDKTAAYAAVATLLGARMGTELIPTLQRGSAAILQIGQDMGTMSDQTIESLDKVHRQTEMLKNQLAVNLGGALSTFVLAWQAGWYDITALVEIAVKTLVTSLRVTWDAFRFDWKAVKQDWQDWAEYSKQQIKGINDYADEQFGEGAFAPKKEEKKAGGSGGFIGLDAAEGNVGGAGGSGGSSAGTGANSIDSLKARAAKLAEDSLHRQQSLEEKLVSLQKEKQAIVDNLVKEAVAGTQTEEDYYQAQVDAAEKEKEIEATKKSINDEQEKYNAAVQLAREQAEAEVSAEQERTQYLQDVANFGETIAGQMKVQRDLQDQINDAIDAANQAWSEGDDILAQQNEQLADQLRIEKDLTAEADKQANAAQKARDEEAAVLAKANDKLAHAQGLTVGLQAGNFDYAMGGATPGEQQRLEALEQLGGLTGTDTLGFEKRASLKAAFTAKSDKDYAAQLAAIKARQTAQAAYLRIVATGGTPSAAQLTQFGAVPLPAPGLGGASLLTAEGTLNDILAQQKITNELLTPKPTGR